MSYGYREEREYVQRERPNEPPPDFGMTLLAVPTAISCTELLERIRQVWSVVATWGRWCDEELGDWPESQAALEACPVWLRSAWLGEPAFEWEQWLDDLHDRAWTWWSGAVVDDQVKIDVNAESLPLSLWPLRTVVEKAGGVVIFEDLWRAAGNQPPSLEMV
ncbi:MAG TPA: hypothetical protein VKT82_08775 [Ktedonobacterales bacterium]|nr:hypothetical protein [Ktedonobacterales bacterium]